jgi:hypothetical protein
MKLCTVAGCGRESYARGWCTRHYQCWRRHGDPNHVTLRAVRTSTAHTFLGFHPVKWEPTIWAPWWRDRVDTHPHAAHLAEGIAQFRGMLVEQEARTGKKFP